MDNSIKHEEQNQDHMGKAWRFLAEVILVMWMAGIVLLNLLIFTPPVVWSMTEQLNVRKQFTRLHNSAQEYFLSTDYSRDSLLSSPLWDAITTDR